MLCCERKEFRPMFLHLYQMHKINCSMNEMNHNSIYNVYINAVQSANKEAFVMHETEFTLLVLIASSLEITSSWPKTHGDCSGTKTPVLSNDSTRLPLTKQE